MSAIGVGQREDAVGGVEGDGCGFFLGYAEFFAQAADGDDEFLQGLHRALGDWRRLGSRRPAGSG